MSINLSNDLKPLKDGSLIFSSERSGHRQLYRWNKGKISPLTKGEWEVDEVAGIDQPAGKLYFTANRETSIEKHFYALDYRKAGAKPRLLTRPGTSNAAKMDETGKLALITTTAPGQPPQAWLADATGKRLAWVEENRVAGSHPYAPFIAADVAPKFGRLIAAEKRSSSITVYYSPSLRPANASRCWLPSMVVPRRRTSATASSSHSTNIWSSRAGHCSRSATRSGRARHRLPATGLPCAGENRGRRPTRRARMA